MRGDAKVKAFGDPGALCDYGPFLDETGAVIATPVRARQQGDFAVVSFKEPFSREAIQALKGVLLHVPREALPDPDADEYYHADLIGLRAQTPEGAPLGEVRAVHDFGAGDVLEIAGGDETLMVPFTKANAPVVNLQDGVVVIAPLESAH